MKKNSEDILFDNPMAKRKILILCKGNTCRSAIFHNYLSYVSKDKNNYEIYSAGYDVKSQKISDEVTKLFMDNLIPLTKTKTNSIKEYKNTKFDDIIILDKNIKRDILPKTKRTHTFILNDPYGKTFKEYSSTLREIKKYIKNFN